MIAIPNIFFTLVTSVFVLVVTDSTVAAGSQYNFSHDTEKSDQRYGIYPENGPDLFGIQIPGNSSLTLLRSIPDSSGKNNYQENFNPYISVIAFLCFLVPIYYSEVHTKKITRKFQTHYLDQAKQRGFTVDRFDSWSNTYAIGLDESTGMLFYL